MSMTPPSSTSSTVLSLAQNEMAPPWIDKCEADPVLEELRRRRDVDDVEFFHRLELDADGYLKNLFWAHTGSRLEYIYHGDVVVFDTTYRTNKYGVPFVPFLGLSLHRTPVVFGCGIILDQSVDSIVWLLRAFRMSNVQETPKSVITDGSDAVTAAIKIVFPESNHRMCSWHVEQGIDLHLHCSSRNEFRSLMFDLCSPAAFDQRWHSFMAKHRTVRNQAWLDAMYDKRELWAAAFVHDKFFLGLANDQRTECLATDLHTGLDEGMSLMDLLAHTNACTAAMCRGVYVLDRKIAMSRMVLTTKHRNMEELAARWFTPANFYLLREEIKMMDSFQVVETMMRGHPTFGKKVYTVGFKQRPGVVFYVASVGNDVNCSCRKMEREGLPCRHILCVLRHTHASQIPDCCKLRRLRRRDDIKVERLVEMKDLGSRVFDLTSEDAQEFQEIKDFLEGWLEERQRKDALVAEEDDGTTTKDGGTTPTTKKIKFFND